jgi:multiple sugar transport system substrate-binding protein
MKSRLLLTVTAVLLGAGLLASYRLAPARDSDRMENQDRQEVTFWHFWGGADRDVVDGVVRRFNQSQDRYFVRAIPMPGNNLQAKLFLATAGGDPPDLVNQDDPIVGDWGWRGIIQSLDSICSPAEVRAIREHLFPSARKLGTFDGKLFGVCNGLDIRALYCNQTALDQLGMEPPQSIAELDAIAQAVCPAGTTDPATFGYLPDSRRLWAWGQVWGGQFYDFDTRRVLLGQSAIVAAARWMAGYARWYGPDTINRFRQGDQSLPGKTFPLLPVRDDEMTGRYVILMDGQWRVRDIDAFVSRRRRQGIPCPRFTVCPLPFPSGGRRDAGWVNGNFFVIPRGAGNPRGAVEFMKFWIGLTDPGQAALTCAAGG